MECIVEVGDSDATGFFTRDMKEKIAIGMLLKYSQVDSALSQTTRLYWCAPR